MFSLFLFIALASKLFSFSFFLSFYNPIIFILSPNYFPLAFPHKHVDLHSIFISLHQSIHYIYKFRSPYSSISCIICRLSFSLLFFPHTDQLCKVSTCCLNCSNAEKNRSRHRYQNHVGNYESTFVNNGCK